jgi:hypothetical protein
MRTILGPGGKVRALVRECGDRTELLTPGGRLLGYYMADKDQTLLPGGSLYSYGYCLMELIEE